MAAEEARRRLEGVEEEARKMMEEATRRSNELVSAAVADSQRIVESARTKAEADVAARMAAAKNQIEIEKQKALGEMRTTVALLSVDVAERVLRQRLEEEDASGEYIARLIDEAERDSAHKA